MGLSCSEAKGIIETVARRHVERLSVDGRLTVREREITRLIEMSLSNKEISAKLNISHSTVKNHVHGIMQKLSLHRRVDVAEWSRLGLI